MKGNRQGSWSRERSIYWELRTTCTKTSLNPGDSLKTMNAEAYRVNWKEAFKRQFMLGWTPNTEFSSIRVRRKFGSDSVVVPGKSCFWVLEWFLVWKVCLDGSVVPGPYPVRRMEVSSSGEVFGHYEDTITNLNTGELVSRVPGSKNCYWDWFYSSATYVMNPSNYTHCIQEYHEPAYTLAGLPVWRARIDGKNFREFFPGPYHLIQKESLVWCRNLLREEQKPIRVQREEDLRNEGFFPLRLMEPVRLVSTLVTPGGQVHLLTGTPQAFVLVRRKGCIQVTLGEKS